MHHENEITLAQAIEQMLHNENHEHNGSVVTGFCMNDLTHLPEASVYNHNFYSYNGHTILVTADDYNELTFDLLVGPRKYYNIGVGYDPFDDETEIELFPYF